MLLKLPSSLEFLLAFIEVGMNIFQNCTLQIHICYLLAGRSLLRKTVPEVLSTAQDRRLRAVPFLNTDRPRKANNVFIFSCGKLLYKK